MRTRTQSPLIFSCLAGSASIAALSGCAGVPQLYSPPAVASAPAPKVADIVDEISCELARSTKARLGTTPYVITILLTLQVDDNLDLTPSLSFIHALAGSGHSRVFSMSGDLGGARKRTFTATYYLDSEKLALLATDVGTPDRPALCAGRPQRKFYNLSGNLGLDDTVRDGTGALALSRSVSHLPTNPNDKAVPAFGSQVQFVVTKALSGLGPLWTVERFKGPSGSNGLVNGKRVNTDSMIITFAPHLTFGSTVQQAATKRDLEAVMTARQHQAGQLKQLTAQADAREREEAAARARLQNPPKRGAFSVALALKAVELSGKLAKRAAQERDAAAQRQLELQQELERATRALEAANAEAAAQSPAAATQADQLLLNFHDPPECWGSAALNCAIIYPQACADVRSMIRRSGRTQMRPLSLVAPQLRPLVHLDARPLLDQAAHGIGLPRR